MDARDTIGVWGHPGELSPRSDNGTQHTVWESSRRTFMADGVDTILLMYVSIALTMSMMFTVKLLDAASDEGGRLQFTSSDAWEA